MYLDFKQKRRPFAYSINYNSEIYAIEFSVNPVCVPIFKQANQDNLMLQYCRKLGFVDIETDLEKNFGIGGYSINYGLANGLIKIQFPIKPLYIVSKTKCGYCKGSGKQTSFNEKRKVFYLCRGTGKDFVKKTNIDEQCASIYLLTRYLNWLFLMNDDLLTTENDFGNQDLFLEVDATNGVGGECSKDFFSKMAMIDTQAMEKSRQKDMFDLYAYCEGRHLFPKVDFYQRESEFRSEINETGHPYIEVPGQNGCSIHMQHNSRDQFTCHNIDVPQQQFCLLAGFAMMWRDYYAI